VRGKKVAMPAFLKMVDTLVGGCCCSHKISTSKIEKGVFCHKSPVSKTKV
jgi:hypothetical protein